MLHTYRAILKGNRLEWDGDVPEQAAQERAVAVYITILDESVMPQTASQGERMAAELEQLAASNALAHITDPAAWERDLRQDRALPGRER